MTVVVLMVQVAAINTGIVVIVHVRVVINMASV
jgi:hypothetical protein